MKFMLKFKMQIVVTILMCSILCSIVDLEACRSCCQINAEPLPHYNLMKSSARSNQLIISRAMLQDVDECKTFARAKKALAFNYGIGTDLHGWNGGTGGSSGRRNICQALECPEIDNFTTIVQDKHYRYYSAYPDSITTGPNFTMVCLPRTGIFLFSRYKLNYSQARIVCQKMNGSLAHIISEERTNGLAKHISPSVPAFVGLSSTKNDTVWKNEFGEVLSCFNYRAWGRGEPMHSKGCVGLARASSSVPGPFWRVISCDSILPFICEVSPMHQYLYN